MNSYSENWQHLKSLLTGYESRNHQSIVYTYEDHRHAKALSIFLANSKLATPPLDRNIVSSILTEGYRWPGSINKPLKDVNFSLSQLEEWGLISFYADWCSIHCNSVRDLTSIDPSLLPLIKTIDHLKDILSGQNGCIQPHYVSSEIEIKKLLSDEFGTHLTIEQLLPELRIQDGLLSLPHGNHYFDSLISTYFWQRLCFTQSPEQAFSNWISCMRVNCEWAMPVIFEMLQFEERKEFNTQFCKFLVADPAITKDLDLYIRQSINEEAFSHNIRKKTTTQNNLINNENKQLSSEEEDSLPTLHSLDNIYPTKEQTKKNDLDFLFQFQNIGINEYKPLFYSWLLSSVVNDNIRIDNQHLFSSDLIENLLEHTDSRPILKYMMFIILPRYERSKYMLVLLAQSSTSEIGLYYLSKQKFENSSTSKTKYVCNLEVDYQLMVCHEYIKSIKNQSDFPIRLLRVLEHLGNRCNFKSSEFTKDYQYLFFNNFLKSLDSKQVVQLAQTFIESPIQIEDSDFNQIRQHYKYLLGFWLIERIETSGIDSNGTICRALRDMIHNYYNTEVVMNLKGLRSLDANSFFATLPWGKLIVGIGPNAILALSNNFDEWKSELSYKSTHSFHIASLIRNYLQVLMCLGRPTSSLNPIHRVPSRVNEIIRFCCFSDRKKFVQPFEKSFEFEKYHLWEQVCSYINIFHDDLFDDFMTRVDSIPLDNLFILLEKCTVIARINRLKEVIDIRQSKDNNLDLAGLEQAFISACESERFETANKLLKSAQKILCQAPFISEKNNRSIRYQIIWKSYEYKLQLLKLYEENRLEPETFLNVVYKISIPENWNGNMHSPDAVYYNECEYFRRQLIAIAFFEYDPAKSVKIMTQLYKDTNREHHGFLLLHSHLKLYFNDNNQNQLQQALAYFLTNAGNIEPKLMNETWVTTILDIYRLLDLLEIDSFWAKLSTEQQTLLQILTPYCRALISRDDPLTARKILNRYQTLNKSTPDDLGIDDLISELVAIEANIPSMANLIQLLNESSQRTVIQLRKHYNEIVSKDFETYVDIVAPELPQYEYLKNAVFLIANELTLRKRNLQIEVKKNGKTSYKIMKEDLINDWFVSLFDHRMSQARIGFRDQKRGGLSASGKSPGEIDGFITSADNTRIAIFEAFRLFSQDSNTVSKHLNKIVGYDTESLNPVFIVAYCDVNDFIDLTTWYSKYISSQEYTGYTVAEESSKQIAVIESKDHLWVGSEVRRRDRKDINFYHILINLHFYPPDQEK